MSFKHANRLWHETIKSFGAASFNRRPVGATDRGEAPEPSQDHGGTSLPAPDVMTE